MLSYSVDEAEELLDGKHKAAKQTLANCEEDLDFLREQITVSAERLSAHIFHHDMSCVIDVRVHLQTMDVAVARVYNWDVVQRRKEKAGIEDSKGKGKENEEPNG